MTEEQKDLVARIKEYKMWLHEEIERTKRIELEESLFGSISAMKMCETYKKAEEKMYNLFPELTEEKEK